MPESSPVRLVVPGTRDHLRLARLTASGMAAVHELPIERVEAIRAAVDAVGVSLIEAGQGRPLRLDFQVHQEVLEITGSTDSGSDLPDSLQDSLQMEINRIPLNLRTGFQEADGQALMRVQIPLQSQG